MASSAQENPGNQSKVGALLHFKEKNKGTRKGKLLFSWEIQRRLSELASPGTHLK